jgi:hypothetical protein
VIEIEKWNFALGQFFPFRETNDRLSLSSSSPLLSILMDDRGSHETRNTRGPPSFLARSPCR